LRLLTRTRAPGLLGWFGPRGLASIILALVVVEEEPGLPALDAILAVMTFTVLVSIALTASALDRWPVPTGGGPPPCPPTQRRCQRWPS